jgi:hypothetical protein
MIHSTIAPQSSTLQPKGNAIDVLLLITNQASLSKCLKVTNYRQSILMLKFAALSPFKTSPSSHFILSKMLLLTPSPPPVPTLSLLLIGPTSPLLATFYPVLGMTGPPGLVTSQLLVGWAPMTSCHEINSALSMPPPPLKGVQICCTIKRNLFTQASSLVDVQNAEWDHLTACGMDTMIAHFLDPENLLTTTNVVKRHSGYTVATAKALAPSNSALWQVQPNK